MRRCCDLENLRLSGLQIAAVYYLRKYYAIQMLCVNWKRSFRTSVPPLVNLQANMFLLTFVCLCALTVSHLRRDLSKQSIAGGNCNDNGDCRTHECCIKRLSVGYCKPARIKGEQCSPSYVRGYGVCGCKEGLTCSLKKKSHRCVPTPTDPPERVEVIKKRLPLAKSEQRVKN